MAELEQIQSMLVEVLRRFDGVDQRFDGIDQTLERHSKTLRWLKRRHKKMGLEFEKFRSDNGAVSELLREEDLVKRLVAVEKELESFEVRLDNLELAPGSEGP